MHITTALAIALATLAGLSVTIQVSFNNVLTAHVGNLWTIFVSHFGGALVALFLIGILVVWNMSGQPITAGFRSAPLYSLTGGAMGVIMVGSVLTALQTLPLGHVLALVTFGQLALALVFDHFGFFGVPQAAISPLRILGVLLLAAGTYLLRR